MNPKVSIIMPVLNGEAYIEEALNSIISQTLESIEILVVDAGSMDETKNIVKRFSDADARIKLIDSDKKSMGYQYNLGIDNSKGDYVGFVESDDYVDANMFQTLYDFAETKVLDWVKADFNMFLDSPSGRVFLPVNQGEQYLVKNKLYGKTINPSTMPELILFDANHWKGIYRRDFLKAKDIRFNTTSGAAFQDAGFVQQTLAFAEKASYMNEHLYFYRRDNINCSTASPKGILYYFNEFLYIVGILEQRRINDCFLKSVYVRAFNMFFSQLEKMPNNLDVPSEIENVIVEYLKNLRKGVDAGYITSTDFPYEKWIDFLTAESYPREFVCYYTRRVKIINMRYRKHLVEVFSHPEVCLCGYGSVGKQYKCLLCANGYAGKITVCDNGNKAEEEHAITNSVRTMEETIKQVGRAAYCMITVKDRTKVEEIRRELNELGISDDHIRWFDLPINPYVATTNFM